MVQRSKRDENPLQNDAFIARLKAREPEALQRFFEHYFQRLYSYVRGMVRDEHESEDLTQEIFLNLQRSLDRFDGSRDLDPWVYTIATNKVRDHWRSRRHHDSLSSVSVERDGALERFSRDDESPSHELERKDNQRLLRAAIAKLSDKNRSTLLMRAEGHSFDAIGQALGSNEVAVRKRYSRALEALRELLFEPGTPSLQLAN